MFTRVRASLLLWNVSIIGLILLAAGSVTYFSQRQSLLSDVDRLLVVTARTQPGPYLATNGQPPPWFLQQVPFSLVVDADGHVLADPQQLPVKDVLLPTAGPVPLRERLALLLPHGSQAQAAQAVPVAQKQVAFQATSDGTIQERIVSRAIASGQISDGQPPLALYVAPSIEARPAGGQAVDDQEILATGTIAGQPVRLLVFPVMFQRVAAPPAGGDVPYPIPAGAAGPSSKAFLVTGVSLVPMEETLHQTLVVLLIGGAAGVLLSFLGSWFLAGRALIPIETAYRRQQEFVADAAHELRTPLTILQTSTHLLNQHRQEPLDAQGPVFDDLREEIGRLTRLSCDLLDLARSDLGQLSLTLGRVDLAPLGDTLIRRLSALAGERQIHLRFEGAGQPCVVEADSDRLQQALLVLLDNALKHTPPGGAVTLAVSRAGRSATVQVRDTGEGMPPDVLRRVFDRFYRGDPARSRTTDGAGLGLAIARTLVEAHGGALSLSSVVGVGTTAAIHLPLTSGATALDRSWWARRPFRRPGRWLENHG